MPDSRRNFTLRLPDELREALTARAARNRRSLNNEIISILEWQIEAAGEETK